MQFPKLVVDNSTTLDDDYDWTEVTFESGLTETWDFTDTSDAKWDDLHDEILDAGHFRLQIDTDNADLTEIHDEV